MSEDSATLLSTALGLAPADREEVATALWDSLNFENDLDDTADDELLAETLRRRDEIRSGDAIPIRHAELKEQLGQ